jgi:[glutamine synthetase] adenylyltransferase / [glutamine synthetase]-adenylyl-L-tyrosine phosphorylase
MNGAPPSRDPASALLTRLKVNHAEGVRALRALRVWSEDGSTPRAEAVVAALSGSPCPDLALRAAERIAERRGPESLQDPETLRRVGLLSSVSDAFAELLAARGAALAVLEGELLPDTAEDVRRRCGQALDEEDDPARVLAVVQRLGLLRVAARDMLGLVDTPTAAHELSELAAGMLAAALDHVAVDGARVAIIGMGKLGGSELNYVSDIDVMFVHQGDRGAAQRTAERVMRLLGTQTPDGTAYEVDANLRPEGRDGPLSRTLEAYGSYYERWAHTWEYQALLKARPVAGDPELGDGFTELTRPYVYPDRRDAASVQDIQKMKESVETSAAVRKAGARQIKLAPGGIRDIEFAVQLLQLVHGRHDPDLRSPNTLAALKALADGGYVDDGDANLFGDAYQFLRTVEHRLQLRRLRRTHVLPEEDEQRARLARVCGFRDIRVATALEQFDREYARVQGYVRRLHEKLFFRPLLARFAELSAADQLPLSGREELGPKAARDRLAALGFADAEGALRDLDALAGGVSRRARLMRTLLPAMMPVLAATPDPNGGLAGFHSLAERLANAPAFLRTLRDNPPVGETLARVLGCSRLVGEWLAREPELIGRLGDQSLDLRTEPEEYARAATGLLRRGDDQERTADALRRFTRRGVARVAVRDLTGRADVVDVAAELTGIADACLGAGVELVLRELPVRFTVVGMGKLGGRELTYASDLDVILVFDPPDARAEALGAADELVRSLSAITGEGQAFLVDLGLRPEGRDGPVARTFDSTLAYYRQWAESWELQALTQARVVAGDEEMGGELLKALEPLVYPERLPAARLQAMRQMKARVERERGGARPRRTRPTRTSGTRERGGVQRGERVDLKLGPGGLSDVDWTVQMLQLRHGGSRAALRTPGTLAGLAAAREEGLLSEQDASWLRDGWLFLTGLRNALYLRGNRDTAVLPPSPPDRDQLAGTVGYPSPGGQALTEDVGRTMRRIRRVHERLFYDV